jgi:hypothetical protein
MSNRKEIKVKKQDDDSEFIRDRKKVSRPSQIPIE